MTLAGPSTEPEAPLRTTELWPRVLLGAGVLASLIYCVVDSAQIIDPDPFTYGKAAQGVLKGLRLYSDIWQDKPPLGLLAYALPQLVSPASNLALQVFLWLILTLQALLLFRALRAEDAPAAAGAAVLILCLPPACKAFCWLSTEHLSNLFALPLLLMGWRIHRDRTCSSRQGLAAGALAGLAFCTRQTALMAAVVPVFAVLESALAWRAKGAALLRMVGAFALVLAAVILLTWPIADLPRLLFTVFVYPFGYAEQKHPAFLDFLGREFPNVTLSCAFVALFALCMGTTGRRLVMVATLGALVAVWAPHRTYPHYALALLPVAALMVFLAGQLAGRLSGAFARALVMGPAVCLLFLPVPRCLAIRAREMPDLKASLDQVARLIAANHLGAERLLIGTKNHWAESYLYFVTQNPTASPFFLSYQVKRDGMLPERKRQILEEYRLRPPQLLLLEPGLSQKDEPAEWDDVQGVRDLARWLLHNHRYSEIPGSDWSLLRLDEPEEPRP